jgi:hypothetical protein
LCCMDFLPLPGQQASPPHEPIPPVPPEWEWVQPESFVDGANGVFKIGRGSRARVWRVSHFESDIAYVEGSTSHLGDCTLFNVAVVLITV